jgi:hypothetical protein
MKSGTEIWGQLAIRGRLPKSPNSIFRPLLNLGI